MMRFLFPVLLLVAGCDRIPADPDGTLERIRAERTVRVGVIAGTDPAFTTPAALFLARVDEATGARARITRGPAERLLTALEEGAIDLVIGELAPDSPWATRVAVLRPIAERTEDGHAVIAPIARNGENRWIMLLEREARAARAEAGEGAGA